MAETDNRPIILWLDDKKDEIQDQKEALEKTGYVVRTAGDIMTFQNEVQEICHGGKAPQLRLVVLDIMLEGVIDISRYYRDVTDGSTSNGYAAGLVFLERVIMTNAIYTDLRRVPLAVNSKRAMNRIERQRIERIISDYDVEIEIFEKSASRAISDFLAARSNGATGDSLQ